MPEKNMTLPHSVFIEDRKKIKITGITDVGSFDEETLNIETPCGYITVKGENLQVTQLSLESGELAAEGIIDSVNYSQLTVKGKGFFSKVFGG